MKKQLPGFIAGLLCAVVLFGVTVGAGALITGPTNISVSPINIIVNGEVFQPKGSSGELVDVFNYGGVTYVPLRAIAETFGLEVGWDAEKNLATVNKPGSSTSQKTEDKDNDILTAIDKDGKEVRYTTNDTVVYFNEQKQTTNVIQLYSVNYFDVNLVLENCGLEKISNQEIIEVIKITEEEDNVKFNYLLIDNVIYAPARSFAPHFGLDIGYDIDEKAVKFWTK